MKRTVENWIYRLESFHAVPKHLAGSRGAVRMTDEECRSLAALLRAMVLEREALEFMANLPKAKYRGDDFDYYDALEARLKAEGQTG